MSDAPPPVPVEAPEIAAARERAGRALRDLSHALVGHHASETELAHAAAAIEAVTAGFTARPLRSRPEQSFGYTWAEPPVDGQEMETYGDRPFSGKSSPWGLDMSIHREGDEAVARVTLRSAHEGAPARSHGGVVAAIFDDVMGFVLQIEQIAAFTGELWIRFERGVRLHVPLEVRAALDRVEGRKIHIHAEMTDAGEVVARSRGLFISVPAIFPLADQGSPTDRS